MACPISPLHFREKHPKLAMILLPRPRLHAASNIHSIRAHKTNRVAHVFRREPACENDTVRFCRTARKHPISAFSCTAILACSRCVEQKSGSGSVRAKVFELKVSASLEGLGNLEMFRALPYNTRSLVAVQLDRVER